MDHSHFGETEASKDAQMYHNREKANFTPWPGSFTATKGETFREYGYGHGMQQTAEDRLERHYSMPDAAKSYTGEYTNRSSLKARLQKATNDEKAIPEYDKMLSKLDKDIKDKEGKIPQEQYNELCQQYADVKTGWDELRSNPDRHYNTLVRIEDGLKDRITRLETDVEKLQNENASLREQLEEQQKDSGSKAQRVTKGKSKKGVWGRMGFGWD